MHTLVHSEAPRRPRESSPLASLGSCQCVDRLEVRRVSSKARQSQSTANNGRLDDGEPEPPGVRRKRERMTALGAARQQGCAAAIMGLPTLRGWQQTRPFAGRNDQSKQGINYSLHLIFKINIVSIEHTHDFGGLPKHATKTLLRYQSPFSRRQTPNVNIEFKQLLFVLCSCFVWKALGASL